MIFYSKIFALRTCHRDSCIEWILSLLLIYCISRKIFDSVFLELLNSVTRIILDHFINIVTLRRDYKLVTLALFNLKINKPELRYETTKALNWHCILKGPFPASFLYFRLLRTQFVSIRTVF